MSTLGAACRTSSAGPGFHQHVCEVLDQLADDFGILWDLSDGSGDETEYFQTRDRESLEQHMLSWFTNLASISTRDVPDDHTQMIGMALDPQFTTKGEVLTSLGPRSREWLKAAAHDFEAARKYFAWWDAGLTARTLVRWAKVHMWCNVCWAVPETQLDIITHYRVTDLLQNAHALDPRVDIPWRNWNELIQLDPEPEHDADLMTLIQQKAAAAKDAPIGYRRDDVRRTIGGWTFTHPGEFFDQPSEEDESIVFARGSRFVRGTFISLKNDDHPNLDEYSARVKSMGGRSLPAEHERVDGEVIIGVAADYDSDVPEEPGFYLQGIKAKPGLRVMLTIGYPSANERAWAIKTWKSFK